MNLLPVGAEKFGEKFEKFTCGALQLTVIWLLGGVYVFLDQKRAWHLGN